MLHRSRGCNACAKAGAEPTPVRFARVSWPSALCRKTPIQPVVAVQDVGSSLLSCRSFQSPPEYRLAPELVSQAEISPSMGLTLHMDPEGGLPEASLRLWSPHAAALSVLVKGCEVEVPLTRQGDDWTVRLAPGVLGKGDTYQICVTCPDGRRLTRRDPWARSADYYSNWCYADDGGASFKWSSEASWELPAYEHYSIYELQLGSFTSEGTLEAAGDKLEHIAGLGFTAVQLMPITEFSDAWGYNPRQLLAVHGAYGSPDQLRAFVDRCHTLGLAVIVDVVLNHGAVEGNALWDWDGWSPHPGHGGLFHEGAHDTQWGRAFAVWKREVRDMLYASCAMWLTEYKCDGLRFDSANDLPRDLIQELTWKLKDQLPGRFLTAEVTPENPQSVHECGFHSVWVHSGYFDIIQQHRALGRGHHGGGDWAAGWDLPRLRTVMVLHYGFTHPTQCIKYLLGSHDQIGCRKGGAWYEDYKEIGGQHRYAVDQYGGGRNDKHATSSARLWWTANVIAAGIPMMFMGTEWSQGGWWDTTEHRRPQWSQSEDEEGQAMMRCVKQTLALRKEYGAIRHGGANVLHEDRQNGVVAFERVAEGEARIVCVINAGRKLWQSGEYGVWVGGGVFEQLFCSQVEELGGFPGVISNAGETKPSYDGKLFINLPNQCTLVFKQVS
ncbi:glycoside hydrolase superfamily [Haematococcus lacustris]